MLMEMQAQRFVQRLAGLVTLTGTSQGSARVALAEGDGDEHTRAGLRYIMSATGATGIAPVQAIPSTAAAWLFWNPAGNTVAAFLDSINVALLSGTGGAGASFYGIIVPNVFAPTTVPTANASNVKVMNCNPVSGKMSTCILTSGQTLVNAAVGNWFPLGQMNPNGTVLAQTVMYTQADIKGKIVIPPGCGFGITVVSPTGTSPLFAPIINYREYSADLE